MKATARDENSGMTLLEVMVALMLLCVGIMAVAAMLNVSLQSNTKAQTGVEDCIAAAMMMEKILALPYDDSQLEDSDDGFHPQDPDHGPFDVGVRSSTIEWEVDRDFPTLNTKRILVTVRQKSQQSASLGYRYDYVKTKYLTFSSAGVETD